MGGAVKKSDPGLRDASFAGARPLDSKSARAFFRRLYGMIIDVVVNASPSDRDPHTADFRSQIFEPPSDLFPQRDIGCGPSIHGCDLDPMPQRDFVPSGGPTPPPFDLVGQRGQLGS